MRQLAGRLNRVWLTVTGVVLLLIGVTGVLASTGALTQLLTAAGTGINGPVAGAPTLGQDAGRLLGQTLAAVVVAVIGVILGLLGLAWLLAQIPRANAAREFRLRDDAITGLTVCDPGILAAAVEDEVSAYAGVNDASAVLRGTAKAPELTVKVSVDDRADIRQLLSAIREQATANLSSAMDVPLAHLAIQLDIERGKRATTSAVL